MRDDLNDVQVFAAVVDAGSFTAAGRKLTMPKSTVSTRVSQLEERLNTRLLERTTRRLSLTEAGRIYFHSCQRVLAELTHGREAVAHLNEAPRGILRVSLPFAFARSMLTPLLPEFTARFPELSLHLDVNNRRADLLSENIDVALRVKRHISEETESTKIAEVVQNLVAGKGYVDRYGLPKKPADLVDHHVLAWADGNGEAHLWRENGDPSRVVTVIPRIAVGEPESRAEMVRRNLGIGWLPSFLCDPGLASGDLVACLPDHPIPNAIIYAVTPTIRSQDHRVQAFVDFLRESFEDTF